MKCIEADALMQRSLDGALSSSERTELDRHLAHCPKCALAYEEYRSLTRLVRKWSAIEPEPAAQTQAFVSSVMHAIGQAPPRPRSAMIPSLVIAGFVIIVTVAVNYWTPIGSSVTVGLGGPVHPVGVIDAAVNTLLGVPQDALQSLQGLMSPQTGLPLNTVAWTALATVTLVFAGRVLMARRRPIAGGGHG